MHYLDANATQPLRPVAAEAVMAALAVVGNPSSVHGAGRAVRRLLEDAREFEYHLRLKNLERAALAPDLTAEGLAARLFECATRVGADSIAAPGGDLAIGHAADFFTVDLSDLSIAGADQSSLLSHIVFAGEKSAIREVYIGGRAVFEDGRHPLQEEIVERFARVQKRLWNS